MALDLVVFVATGALVVVASTVLTGAADAIAERTGLGRAWIGAVLLAGSTSLPELMPARPARSSPRSIRRTRSRACSPGC